jgi:Glycoside hydrolase 123, catalytic domain/Glycoside hydrolase 123, N-terminal domain
MTSVIRSLLLSALLALLILPALPGPRATGAEASSASGIEVLNNKGELRAFLVFRTPMVVSTEGKLRVALSPVWNKRRSKGPKPLPDFQSPLPPKNWRDADFDDSAWDRQLAPVEMDRGSATGRSHAARHTATVNSMICLRIKFKVVDPARAGDIQLGLKYVGGALVYLNGKEVARRHLPTGEIKPDTLAEKYPDDLYCEPGGMFLQDVKKNPAGFKRRYREISGLKLPAKLIRKGTNVLALELHRAAVGEKAIKAKRVARGGMYRVPGIWAYVGLRSISLSCASADAVTSCSTRPSGVQVWNVAPFETIDAFSYGDPSEPLKPITVNAAINSVFSGRLAVSSDAAIKNLKVSVTDLKPAKGKGTLPSSAVRIRYAEAAVPARSWTPGERFGGLLDKIPPEIPVTKLGGWHLKRSKSPRKRRSSGAVASLWFTVRVPKTLPAGSYSGTVTVSADGLKATKVPLKVNVSGWQLSDPKDFRIKNMICFSAESVAKHYKVKIWGEEHLKLVGKSLALLAEVNSLEVPVNLGTNFYGGNSNEQTMVRWVKGADGKYTYDFTVFDKYLDLVAKHFGKPRPIRLNCWGETDKKSEKNRCVKYVSLLDKKTGKLERLEQPVFGTEASYKFWKPVIDEALKKLKARGWLDITAFGQNSYCYAPKREVVSVAKKLWPEGRWAYTAHNGRLGGSFKGKAGEVMPAMYSSCVWTEGRLTTRGYRALIKPGRAARGLWNNASRCRHWDWSPLIILRNQPEELIMRGHNGIADFGADNFPIENPKRKGRYYNINAGRGTGGGNNASTRALLAPGPDGAVASERFEMFREGTELAEAVLYLQMAIQDKKISGELAAKVEKFLAVRGETFINYWHKLGWNYMNKWSIAGQFDSDAKLLQLAAEVARTVK